MTIRRTLGLLLVPLLVACTAAASQHHDTAGRASTSSVALTQGNTPPTAATTAMSTSAKAPPPESSCASGGLQAERPGGVTNLLDCAGNPLGLTLTLHVGHVITVRGDAGGSRIRLAAVQRGHVVRLSGRYLTALRRGEALVTVRGITCPVLHGKQPTTCPLIHVIVV
jgi:hypothetical protein